MRGGRLHNYKDTVDTVVVREQTVVRTVLLDFVGFHAVSGVAEETTEICCSICFVLRLLFLHVPVQTLRSWTPLFGTCVRRKRVFKKKKKVHAAPYQCFSTRGIKHHANADLFFLFFLDYRGSGVISYFGC